VGEQRSATVAVAPSRSRWWLLGIGIVVALGIVAASVIVVSDSQRRRNQLAVAICRESNVPNAYIRLVLQRSPGFQARKLGLPEPSAVLPILSCQQSVEAGKNVRLAPVEEARYLRIFASGRLPLVHEGRIVGTESFPVAKPEPRP
jgi:hypothetical protein